MKIMKSKVSRLTVIFCTVCFAIVLAAQGCQEFRKSVSNPATKSTDSKFALDQQLEQPTPQTEATETAASSGNGEGYGGKLKGLYYEISQSLCSENSDQLRVSAMINFDEDQATLSEDQCGTIQSNVLNESSIYAADHNPNIIVLEGGRVFEKLDQEPTLIDDEAIEWLCRGKLVGRDEIDHQVGILGIDQFDSQSAPDSLSIDVIVRNSVIDGVIDYEAPLVASFIYDELVVDENDVAKIQRSHEYDISFEPYDPAPRPNKFPTAYRDIEGARIQLEIGALSPEGFASGEFRFPNRYHEYMSTAVLTCTKGVK